MKAEIKKLPKSEVEITVEVSPAELTPFLIKAASKMSEKAKIEGFRPGKAPYDIVKSKFGEMAIMQEALDDIVMKTYFEAVKENNLITLGQPKIDLEKIDLENPFVYKATVAILPGVKIGDLTKLKVKKNEVKVEDGQVEKVIEDIRAMRATESKVDRAAKMGDVVKIDFNVYRDGVPIENGKSQNYPLKLGENRFIPGFEEQVVGLSVGEEKEFKLTFPDTYHEKTLAGKPHEFKVKVNEVAEVILPEVTDEFAKEISGGKFETVSAMKEGVKENVRQEEENKEDKRVESVMLEEAVKACDFEELPEMLVHEEIHRMMHELEDNIAKQGLQFTDYLTSLKKTPDELEHEMEPAAEMRVKTSILAREIYLSEKMEVTPDELDKEISEIAKAYPDNPKVKEQLESETYKDYLKNSLGNKKVIKYLKNIIVK